MSEGEKEEVVEQAGPVFDPPVYIQRYTTVRDLLFKLPGIEKVVDFGCAEGKFIKYLKKLPFVAEIACVDLNDSCLECSSRCSRPAAWDFIFKRHKTLSIKIYKGSVAEKDYRIQDFSAVTCIELIEHLEPEALLLLPANIFGYIRPKVAIFTTPNVEFNVLFPQLKGFRHWDHKFEWTREEFKEWCFKVTKEFPEYSVEFQGIGDPPVEFSFLGCCTQMAVFKKKSIAQPDRSQNLSDVPYILVDENQYPGRSDENEAEDVHSTRPTAETCDIRHTLNENTNDQWDIISRP